MNQASGEVIRFPDWVDALDRAGLDDHERAQLFEAIVAFLLFCKRRRTPVTLTIIKLYLQQLPASEERGVRSALRWFWQAAHKPSAGAAPAVAANAAPLSRPMHRATVPPKAAGDLGGADWERDLIVAIRRAGFYGERKKLTGAGRRVS
jgi:hypothetical protein